ncbi:hypothetical protein XELAEV_18014014mg [Xenopus laevis]|uniref:Uncharacterized protein n=1 Tax=Xenopus laevis TaxID=8355 RepID=A0A974DQZ0_XENLA|nr:hypothetical protein XELAEV_18014014mg [Xenopus laevis]
MTPGASDTSSLRKVHGSLLSGFQMICTLCFRADGDNPFFSRAQPLIFKHFYILTNSNNVGLNFTHYECINFLDLSLYQNGGRNVSSIYRKPNSGNSLLQATSVHPKHVIEAIPIGQLHRLCTDTTRIYYPQFKKHQEIMEKNLKLLRSDPIISTLYIKPNCSRNAGQVPSSNL